MTEEEAMEDQQNAEREEADDADDHVEPHEVMVKADG